MMKCMNDTSSGAVLVMAMPKLSLIRQTLRVFQKNTSQQMKYLAVCSDQELGEKMNVKVTTEESPIKRFIESRPGQHKVIFVCYNSLETFDNALRDSPTSVDLMLCDEGHWLEGPGRKNKRVSIPALILCCSML